MYQRIIKSIIITSCLMIGITKISFAQFEGAIDMKVTVMEDGKPQVMEYSMMMKKDLVASQIKSVGGGEGGGKFIFRGDKKLLWIVNDAEKNYLEISLNDADNKKTNDLESKNKPKVTKTGKTEKLLGYVCDEVIIEDGKEVTHIWGTSKLGNIYQDLMKSFGSIAGNTDPKQNGGWESELEALKLFPLKIISKENGKVTQTQEVIKIESKMVPVKIFDIPAGFKKIPMGLNMQEMMREPDKDDPGVNPDLEKMMKQLQEMQEEKEDTSDGGK
ncbi:MAG: DUF4412 domain-containing protein [Ignavibacteriales bacterium]|nr:DUF4412 domain-containing protein [Ignavibacteriales bacterium]